MSTYDAERMLKPAFFRIAPLKAGRGKREIVVIGFDSEQDTDTGAPMLFQFSRVGGPSDVELRVIPDTKHAGINALMAYVDDTCRSKQSDYIIVGFNLQYEWSQLFGDLPENPDTGQPIGADDEFVLNIEHTRKNGEREDYTITVANNSRYFATILRNKSHRRIKIIDARAFYTTSLNGAAAMLDLPRKIAMDTKRFTRADLANDHFLEYARQDAYITRRVGEAIVSMHEDFDVRQTVTAPHFAASVFRRHFLSTEIALPPPDLEQAGLYAYHGGKNGYYLEGPRHLTGVYAYDLVSAYPEAMRALPDIERAEWRYVAAYEPSAHALWKVSGAYRSCQYRALLQHRNAWHETGEIVDAWVTSYELDAALARKEIDLTSCEGWILEGPSGGPLTRYVDHFFAQKRTATGASRTAAKLFLNSLYGKFFQKVPLGTVGWYDLSQEIDVTHIEYRETDPSQMFDYQAGGLYHPPIAALITGFVRAKIHTLEHKYGSVMTSTDGFFAIRPPDPSDIGGDLGMLTTERGNLSIWRERLYSFHPTARCDPARTSPDRQRARRDRKLSGTVAPRVPPAPDDSGHRHERDDPLHLRCQGCIGNGDKYALHGFRGTIDALRRVPLTVGAYSYTAQQVITNKLATKSYRGSRYRPGTFAELIFTLTLQANAPP